MSNSATIRDVARAAGVSISTVSFVVNGKAERYRIGRDTQARIQAAIRQLGYQSTSIVDVHAPRPAPATSQDLGKRVQQIGLILSAASQPELIAMTLGLEPVLAAAGYQLVVIVVPADPEAVSLRVIQLLKEGTAGMVCCPSIYATVSAVVAKAGLELGRTGCPVIVLWQGAGKAMVATLQGVSAEREAPIVTKPIVNTVPVVPPPTPPVSPAPRPVTPTPITNPVRPAVLSVAGGGVSAPVVAPVPVLPIPSAEAPVERPDPVNVEKPVTAVEPEILPVQPEAMPEPTPMSVETPEPVPSPGIVETPAPTPEPVAPPESVIEELTPAQPAIDPEPIVNAEVPPPTIEPIETPEPAPAPEIDESPAPVPEPDPVVTPEPVIEELPTLSREAVQAEVPAPVSEPEAPFVQPVAEPEPVVVPAAESPTIEPVAAPEPVLVTEPEPVPVEPEPMRENQVEEKARPVAGLL